MGYSRTSKTPKYNKQVKDYGIWEMSQLRFNPITTNPGVHIDRKIKDMGERLIDFLPKVSKHFSNARSAKNYSDISPRLFKYGLGDDNSFYTMMFLANDLDKTKKEKMCSYYREEYHCSYAHFSENFIYVGWDKGTDNIVNIAEMLFYLGDIKLCEREING